jgi:uncharacterized protein YaiL (DUF2058 family)
MPRVQSLRDQLIKAGLITEAQANGAEEDKSAQPAESASKGPQRTIPPLPPLALPGSRAHQRLAALQQLELDRRLRQLVLASQLPLEPGECAFHFITRKGKVRRLELSESQAKQLEEGVLAIVERPEPAQIEHSIVPAEAAERMLRLSEKSVRFYNRKGAPIGVSPGEDDAPGTSSADSH